MQTPKKPGFANPTQPISGGGGTGGSAVDDAVAGFIKNLGNPPPDAPRPADDPDQDQKPPEVQVEEPKAPDREPAQEPVKPKAAPASDAGGVPADVLGQDEPPAAAVTEDDDDDDLDVEPPAETANDPKANYAWKKVKAERKEFKKRVAELEAELAKARDNQTPDLKEVLELKQQISAYEERIGQYDLSSTKAFKSRFDAPMEATTNRAVSVLVRAGRDPEDAKKLVKQIMDPAASVNDIQNLVADEPFALQGSLLTLATEYADLVEQRQQALDHWSETRAALGEQERRNSEIKLMENIEADTAKAVQQAVKEGNWMFARSAKNEDWNNQVSQREALVKGIMRSGKPEDIVKWVVEGITAQPLRKMFLDANARAESLKEELDNLVKVAPKAGGGSNPTPPKPKPAAPRTPEQFVAETFKK